jgi:signal transduction histidine kinase
LGQPLDALVEGFGDALNGMLGSRFVYLRLGSQVRHAALFETACTEAGRLDTERVSQLGKALTPWLESEQHVTPGRIDDPFGDGQISLAVVLTGHGGWFSWVLAAGSRQGDFPSEYVRLLMRMGAVQVVTALQSAELRAAQAELERERPARDLHDSVSQSLYAIVLNAEAATIALPEATHKILKEIQSLASFSQTELRSLIFGLHPASLESEGWWRRWRSNVLPCTPVTTSLSPTTS